MEHQQVKTRLSAKPSLSAKDLLRSAQPADPACPRACSTWLFQLLLEKVKRGMQSLLVIPAAVVLACDWITSPTFCVFVKPLFTLTSTLLSAVAVARACVPGSLPIPVVAWRPLWSPLSNPEMPAAVARALSSASVSHVNRMLPAERTLFVMISMFSILSNFNFSSDLVIALLRSPIAFASALFRMNRMARLREVTFSASSPHSARAS